MTRHAVRTTVVVVVLSLSVLGPPVQAQDKPSAQELADLRARAEAGDSSAQFNLGDFYAAGQYVEAVVCYRLAAEQGHAEAQFRLGAMYTRGLGVPQNETEAGFPDSRRRVASEAEMKTV